MKSSVFHLGLVLVLLSVVMQADDMKVLSVKGKITASTSKGSASVKTGQRLQSSDKISVPEKGAVTLLHTNGRSIDVRSAGQYKVSDLMAQAASKGNGVAKKFASYVYNELTDTDDSPLSDSHKKNMSVTGSVERAQGDRQNSVDAIEDILHSSGATSGTSSSLNSGIKNSVESVISEDFITIIFPRSSFILEPSVRLLWYKLPAAKEYTIEIRDASDAVRYSTKTTDTTLQLSFDAAHLERAKNYYWSVRRSDKESVRSSEYCLQWSPEDQSKRMQDTLTMIADEVGKGSAFADVVQAQFAEDHGLHVTALKCYTSAVYTSSSEEYKRYFRNYLRRLNLNVDAQKTK